MRVLALALLSCLAMSCSGHNPSMRLPDRGPSGGATSGVVRKQINHPVLGVIQGENWEWYLRRQTETVFPCTGYSTKNVSIAVDRSLDRPTASQLQALVRLKKAPISFRDAIAQAVFRAYVDEIRPEYLKKISDTRYDYGVTLSDLPEALKPDDVWKFVTGLYYVWVNEDSTVSVEYSVTFDHEEELHVLIDGSRVERVWMEE
jgi:hypothetical protein